MKFLVIFLALFSMAASADSISTVAGKRHTGYLGLIGPGGIRPEHANIQTRPQSELPESFDWANHITMPAIRDQKNCGSCYSFAITRAYEAALIIKKGIVADLSEQEIVSCGDAYKCNGGFMSTASYVVTHGQGVENDFPYSASNQRCKKIPVFAKAQGYKLLGSNTKKPTVAEIKTAMMEKGPLFVTVAAGGSGWNGSTDNITGCKNRRTNHMVVLSGWTKDGEWIMNNSWGTSWGSAGYTKMKFGCDMIADEAGYIDVEQVE